MCSHGDVSSADYAGISNGLWALVPSPTLRFKTCCRHINLHGRQCLHILLMGEEVAPRNIPVELIASSPPILRYEALVFVDECHATGFFGPSGRGTPEHFSVEDRVDIVSSTLGKVKGDRFPAAMVGTSDVDANTSLIASTHSVLFSTRHGCRRPLAVQRGVTPRDVLPSSAPCASELGRTCSPIQSPLASQEPQSRCVPCGQEVGHH